MPSVLPPHSCPLVLLPNTIAGLIQDAALPAPATTTVPCCLRAQLACLSAHLVCGCTWCMSPTISASLQSPGPVSAHIFVPPCAPLVLWCLQQRGGTSIICARGAVCDTVGCDGCRSGSGFCSLRNLAAAGAIFYIYIYIERERERDLLTLCVLLCSCLPVYLSIHLPVCPDMTEMT